MLVRAAVRERAQAVDPARRRAEIPGHGTQKINGAYAIGGPGLMIKTVEDFLGNGLEIDHLIEVDFGDFPAFIDAHGRDHREQQEQDLRPAFDNFYAGLPPAQGRARAQRPARAGLRPRAQEQLRPRTRTTAPAPARQQEVLNGIRASSSPRRPSSGCRW